MFLDKIFIFAFIFILLGGLSISLYQHELAHVFFNDKYGLESEYFFDLPWAIGVKTLGPQTDNLKLMHSFNESISYNLVPLLSGIIGVLGMGFWYLGGKIDYWFEKLEKKGITIEAIPPKQSKEIILDKTELI